MYYLFKKKTMTQDEFVTDWLPAIQETLNKYQHITMKRINDNLEGSLILNKHSVRSLNRLLNIGLTENCAICKVAKTKIVGTHSTCICDFCIYRQGFQNTCTFSTSWLKILNSKSKHGLYKAVKARRKWIINFVLENFQIEMK